MCQQKREVTDGFLIGRDTFPPILGRVKYLNLQISVRYNFSRCNNELYLEMVYETAMEKNVYPQSMPPMLFQEPATTRRGFV